MPALDLALYFCVYCAVHTIDFVFELKPLIPRIVNFHGYMRGIRFGLISVLRPFNIFKVISGVVS